MTLKEELEILRGEPIEVFEGDAAAIPCIETSDSERLCKSPVVSVLMITYNHEPYIRRAIEGVMMQEADFEYELIVGEDCSQDKTREICFELQKKYPDKIRVLWWYENVSKLGGNWRRVAVRCRGEFIAICEGDDWWIDPSKLQKQVDVMRRHPDVGLCFCSAMINSVKDGRKTEWHDKDVFDAGKINRSVFFRVYANGIPGSVWRWPFLVTSTTLVRAEFYREALSKYEVFKWDLRLGDLPLWLGVAMVGNVYFLPDCVSQYNVTTTGASGRSNGRLFTDGLVVRCYFLSKAQAPGGNKLPDPIVRCMQRSLVDKLVSQSHRRQCEIMSGVRMIETPRKGCFRKIAWQIMKHGWVCGWSSKWLKRIFACL